MSRACELTGKKPQSGNKVSHSNIKTRTRWLPNLKKKRFAFDSLGKTMTLTLSSRALRTIDKSGGVEKAILNARESALSPRLLRVKRTIAKKLKIKDTKSVAS